MPVVIDFWAPWCEPCKHVSPILERLAGKHGDRIRIFRMNADEVKTTPAEFSVRNIPALLFFKEGNLAKQIFGVPTEDAIEEAVEHLLG
ncbi:MAG: thioredoxin domain-containing protein [bacterium]|nr:thioredoxin domain-containing protein [bacterium]